jgi:hypothetical protein
MQYFPTVLDAYQMAMQQVGDVNEVNGKLCDCDFWGGWEKANIGFYWLTC